MHAGAHPTPPDPIVLVGPVTGIGVLVLPLSPEGEDWVAGLAATTSVSSAR
jgi:hypothetical protein